MDTASAIARELGLLGPGDEAVTGAELGAMDADKTPHEARHTFETNLDNAKGNRKCINMLMGHKSKDVGNRVYNHKTIEQLRETVALLK